MLSYKRIFHMVLTELEVVNMNVQIKTFKNRSNHVMYIMEF